MERNENHAVDATSEQPLMQAPQEPLEELDETVFEDSFQHVDNAEENYTDDGLTTARQGTVSSARFNILSTMVGGGSLSLPLAFAKMGNALLGPLILIVAAVITEFCFRVLLDAARTLSPPAQRRPGRDSLESISAAAFGGTAYCLSTVLVTLMCFFGIVGYCVLLRDMLEPVTKFISPSASSHRSADGRPATADNLTLMYTVLAVTPLCMLQTLTALQKFGAASMCSVFILGVCILYRSLQCTAGYMEHHHSADGTSSSWTDGFRLWPAAWKDVLDVLPLFISCYVCHYNVPVIHNELQDPTPARVQWWLRSTVWGSTLFYMTVGIAGSAYATACSEGTIHGNILFDFPSDDPLLLTGRLCLAVTITLAFPMLTIPARDIVIRTVAVYMTKNNYSWSTTANITDSNNDGVSSTLREPLLQNDDSAEQPVPTATTSTNDEEQPVEEAPNHPVVEMSTAPPPSLIVRLLASVAIFWTGAAVASCVSSIDVVWNLLGSSLSILLSYLIPAGCYLVISKQKPQAVSRAEKIRDALSTVCCWLLILFFTPLMFVSTANAVYNTFFRK
jgi:amino acid permease